MNVKADRAGFEIDGRRYNIGDVLCYPNQNIKGIILFGFYDNGLDYDDHVYGCGFYTIHCELIKGSWEKDIYSIDGISWDFNEVKEKDENIIKQVRNLF